MVIIFILYIINNKLIVNNNYRILQKIMEFSNKLKVTENV